jgi:hypothetical protein
MSQELIIEINTGNMDDKFHIPSKIVLNIHGERKLPLIKLNFCNDIEVVKKVVEEEKVVEKHEEAVENHEEAVEEAVEEKVEENFVIVESVKEPTVEVIKETDDISVINQLIHKYVQKRNSNENLSPAQLDKFLGSRICGTELKSLLDVPKNVIPYNFSQSMDILKPLSTPSHNCAKGLCYCDKTGIKCRPCRGLDELIPQTRTRCKNCITRNDNKLCFGCAYGVYLPFETQTKIYHGEVRPELNGGKVESKYKTDSEFTIKKEEEDLRNCLITRIYKKLSNIEKITQEEYYFKRTLYLNDFITEDLDIFDQLLESFVKKIKLSEMTIDELTDVMKNFKNKYRGNFYTNYQLYKENNIDKHRTNNEIKKCKIVFCR